MAADLLARVAEQYEASAEELERAAKHLRVVQRQLDEHAERHRTKAQA